MVSKRPAPLPQRADHRLAENEMFRVPNIEVAAVLRERGKPPVAYMVDADRNYVGGAFISGLNRDMRERLWQRVTAKAGPPAKGLTMKQGAEWVRPGLRATVRHLKGEEMLRHASLRDIGD